jgi:cysteine synthase
MSQPSTKPGQVFAPAHHVRSNLHVPARLGESPLDRIGNTPLLRLGSLTRDLPEVQILGKAEWFNPGGSVKDRAAANIIAEARRDGRFGSGKILLDSTSGNTGIAYAMLGAAQGFPVTLCMPENVSLERKRILRPMGRTLFIPIRRMGRMEPSDMHAFSMRENPRSISTRISIPMTPIGGHII